MTMLTKVEIEAIRQRVEKSTPGPWKWVPIVSEETFYVGSLGISDGVAEGVYTSHDADFIANARTDIPRLLDEIEQLYHDYYDKLGEADARIIEANQVIDAQEAEIKRLKSPQGITELIDSFLREREYGHLDAMDISVEELFDMLGGDKT